MAEARYMRRMKREHRADSAFDPRKVPAFDGSNLPEYPDADAKGRVIWCGLDTAERLLGDGVRDVTPSCLRLQVRSRMAIRAGVHHRVLAVLCPRVCFRRGVDEGLSWSRFDVSGGHGRC